MKVVILGGGTSPERSISLKSAANVAKAVKQAGYEVIEIDPKDGLDRLPPGSIVFPVLHGVGGEDGRLQAELERRGLPYLGTGSKESETCFDKSLARGRLSRAGLPIADGHTVDKDSYWQNPLSKKPHVLKVSKGGSSIGTYMVREAGNVDKDKVEEVFKLDKKAIIEELIVGAEITVPIFDKLALPVIEIIPPQNGEFDYANKYNGRTQELCPPKSVGKEIQYRAQRLAEEVHEVLGARHFSRVDIMIGDDSRLVVLELNTIPGMTEQSLYPKSAAVAGISMPELMKKFVGLVKRDYNIS